MLGIPSPAPKKSGNLSPDPQARPCPYADSSGLFICTLPDTATCWPSWRTGPTASWGEKGLQFPPGWFSFNKAVGLSTSSFIATCKAAVLHGDQIVLGTERLGKSTPPSRWAFGRHGWAPLVATMKPCRANLGHIRGIPDAHKAEAGSPGPALH